MNTINAINGQMAKPTDGVMINLLERKDIDYTFNGKNT